MPVGARMFRSSSVNRPLPLKTIADASGKVVCTLVPASHGGLNQVFWNLSTYAPQPSAGRAGRGGGGGPPAPSGEYTFTLNAGGKTYVQKARLISRASSR